jgi:hypothetical protein
VTEAERESVAEGREGWSESDNPFIAKMATKSSSTVSLCADLSDVVRLVAACCGVRSVTHVTLGQRTRTVRTGSESGRPRHSGRSNHTGSPSTYHHFALVCAAKDEPKSRIALKRSDSFERTRRESNKSALFDRKPSLGDDFRLFGCDQ